MEQLFGKDGVVTPKNILSPSNFAMCMLIYHLNFVLLTLFVYLNDAEMHPMLERNKNSNFINNNIVVNIKGK